ncbi:T9SS type A sorting domain-containing protein [Bacteroidia bacterium]|nr:T9SS type A sorting domain-containing protein [Bacteroidia bacterium]
MKFSYILKYSVLFLVLILSLTSLAQSLSGNVRSFESAIDLGYANVDIYQGEKLVASVLADKEGNFDVKLDTGVYLAEIIYAGYKKISQEIRVLDDEKADFSLKKDLDSRFKKIAEDDEERSYDDAAEMEKSEIAESSSDVSLGAFSVRSSKRMRSSRPMISKSKETYSGLVTGDIRGEVQGEAGKLTAGEINDFSKWDLWTDLKSDDLKKYQSQWSFSPEHRYVIQLKNTNGVPIADVSVHLIDKSGVRLYSARTDNTGKAELWKSLLFSQKKYSDKMNIEVIYEGKKTIMKKAKEFSDGLNVLELGTKCYQSQKVDIAFVVDATGSMSDELNFLKAELNDVMFKAKQISNTLNFSFANVFYRDYGDAYLTRSHDFTRVLSESVSFISDQRAGGGGDFPEAVEVALDTAINNLNWSVYARARIVFLILDAPPHNTPEIQEKLNRVSKQAAAKGIRIVPLVASGIDKATEYLMRSMALVTNGTYAFLTDNSGIGGSHLAPSTDSYEVETLNDLLVRVIKSYSYMPDCGQQMPELGLNYLDGSILVDTIATETTALESEVTKISWKYYPNPTRGIVNITASADIPELYITDLSGKVLKVVNDIKEEKAVQVNLSGYASGIYLIRYPVGKQWVSGKVVLMRN